MSDTDGTRPLHIQRADPRTRTVHGRFGEVPITGGMNHHPEDRQRAHEQRRAEERTVNHEALRALEPDDVDTHRLHAHDRRTIGWKY